MFASLTTLIRYFAAPSTAPAPAPGPDSAFLVPHPLQHPYPFPMLWPKGFSALKFDGM